MLLYHGTSEDKLNSILKNGIKPIKRKNKDFFYSDKVSYLSDSLAPFFAFASSENNINPVLIELEIDRNKLVPDQSFIAEVAVYFDFDKKEFLPDVNEILNKTTIDLFYILFTSKFFIKRSDSRFNEFELNYDRILNNLDKLKEFSIPSLEYTGMCAYNGKINKNKITKISILNRDESKTFKLKSMYMMNEIISFKKNKKWLRKLTKELAWKPPLSLEVVYL